MSNIIDKIQVSGVTYDLPSGGSGSTTVELTQAEYDALVSGGTVDPNTYYIISDASPADMSNYWTSAQTNSAITQAVSGKVDTSAITTSVTSGSTDSEIPTAKAVFDAIPTGGTGGGKAISAGTNISVTTGETADTVSCTIPYATEGNAGFTLGTELQPNNVLAARVLIGNYISSTTNAFSKNSIGIAIGNSSNRSQIYGQEGVGIGYKWKIGNNMYDNPSYCVAIGSQASAMIAGSIAIGHNAVASGTTKTNINNQIKVDTSNQVYISNSANTSTYCVQEKIETTEAALGGLKLQQISQADYDALVSGGTVDSSTLYIITNVVS